MNNMSREVQAINKKFKYKWNILFSTLSMHGNTSLIRSLESRKFASSQLLNTKVKKIGYVNIAELFPFNLGS